MNSATDSLIIIIFNKVDIESMKSGRFEIIELPFPRPCMAGPRDSTKARNWLAIGEILVRVSKRHGQLNTFNVALESLIKLGSSSNCNLSNLLLLFMASFKTSPTFLPLTTQTALCAPPHPHKMKSPRAVQLSSPSPCS